MMRLRLSAIIFAICATQAFAGEVTIGAVSVSLTAPSGYCELDDKHEDDARVLKSLSALVNQSKLLAVYATCEQLKDFRLGKRTYLSEYAEYSIPLVVVGANAPVSVVKMICGKLLDRKDVDARLRKIITDAGPRIQETIKDLQIGETRFLGVLDEEPNVCYFAVLQKIQAGQGDQITTINLTANTVIKGKLLTYTVFAPYVDETTLSNLLKKQQENVRELAAANYH
jgi:hypothetical protein